MSHPEQSIDSRSPSGSFLARGAPSVAFLARGAPSVAFLARDPRRGGVTPAELRSPRFHRLFRGIYTECSNPINHQLRCAAALAFLLPDGAAIAGRSAAHIYGVGLLRPTDPVEVVVPPGSRIASAGLRVHAMVAYQRDVHDVAGLPVTTPLRTCRDLAQWLDVVESAVVIDQMLHRRLVGLAEITALVQSPAKYRGYRRLASVAALLDGGAESPQESRVRVRLILAGLPRPVTQYMINDHGRFVARVDLAWPDARVAVEYDGLWHAGSTEQIHADRRRLNRLVGSDWVILHITAQRLRDDFDGFVAEVRAALRNRSR